MCLLGIIWLQVSCCIHEFEVVVFNKARCSISLLIWGACSLLPSSVTLYLWCSWWNGMQQYFCYPCLLLCGRQCQWRYSVDLPTCFAVPEDMAKPLWTIWKRESHCNWRALLHPLCAAVSGFTFHESSNTCGQLWCEHPEDKTTFGEVWKFSEGLHIRIADQAGVGEY